MARFRNPGTGNEPSEKHLDEEVQARLAMNDRKAFVPLYHIYYLEISRLSARWLRDTDDAHDATGDIFRKVIEKLHTFGGGSFRKWIYTIAINTLRDRVKQKRSVTELPYTLIDPTPGPEQEAIRQIDAERLRLALSRLPEESAVVVELRSAGYASKEVAVIVGRSDDWVRTTHSRAMKELALMLGRVSDRELRNG